MKKKILFISLFLTAIIAAINVTLNPETAEDDFMLINVEALAQGEGGHSGCGGTGTVVCDGLAIYYGKYY